MKKIPFKEYQKIDALGWGEFRELAKSYRHWVAYREDKREPKSYEAFGQAAHVAILEPERFDEVVRPAPARDRRTKAGREEHAAFLAALNDDVIVVTQEEYTRLLAMREVVFSDERLSILVSSFVHREITVGPLEMSDVAFRTKGRIDAATEGFTAILEYKTTQDASPESFWHDIRRYQYDLQMCYYTWQLKQSIETSVDWPQLIILAQEKEPPYEVTVWEVDLQESWPYFYEIYERAVRNFQQKVGYPRELNFFQRR